jgi:hypothetical protein
MSSYPKVKYDGIDPTNSDTFVLFSTVDAGWGANAIQGMGLHYFVMNLEHSNDGTLKLYKSEDRGTNWLQIDEDAITAPAASGSTNQEYLVEPYADWKIEWVNGGVTQTTWVLDMSFTDLR